MIFGLLFWPFFDDFLTIFIYFYFSRSNDPQCHCNDGFGGPDCSQPDVNECKYRPCSIHAECTNTLGSFTCACREGKNKTTTQEMGPKYFLTHNIWVIHTSFSLSKWNLYPKINIYGLKMMEINILKSLYAGSFFFCVLLNLWFWTKIFKYLLWNKGK